MKLFGSGTWAPSLELQVATQIGRVIVASGMDEYDSISPPPTAGTVLKVYQQLLPRGTGIRYLGGVAGVEGSTLKQYLDNVSDPSELRPVFMKCWESMSSLHKLGYAHGDLYEDNIIIDPHQHAVLIDLEHFQYAPCIILVYDLDFV
ncbi:hypothetical protein EV426DRAFT_699790 [Tirmania nivea]|nr:hypothetical protein EV426DRAFT_699790 [Tirmania nivea]